MTNKHLYDARWHLLAAITEYKKSSSFSSAELFLRIQSCIEELVRAVEQHTMAQGEKR